MWEIRQGDALDLLREVPADSVDCIVTSPPYFGLRDYGHDGQVGLEATPALYLEKLLAHAVEWFRVLKPTGTLWLNLGDTYGCDGAKGDNSGYGKHAAWVGAGLDLTRRECDGGYNRPKQLLMIPARAAIALCDAGWLLRADIIWAKGNPMPESVTDRPTRSHEHLFLFAKQEKYWFDAQAIAEPAREHEGRAGSFARDGAVSEHVLPGQSAAQHRANREDRVEYNGRGGASAFRGQGQDRKPGNGRANREGRDQKNIGVGPTRNSRDVWTINTRPYREAHFATFPEELPRRCIKAGCPPLVCAECGKPWEREVTTEYKHHDKWFGEKQDARHSRGGAGVGYDEPISKTPGPWQPACTCNTATVPGLVLDPFAGSGTTGMVAVEEGRRFLGFELNEEYCDLARRRIGAAQPALAMA